MSLVRSHVHASPQAADADPPQGGQWRGWYEGLRARVDALVQERVDRMKSADAGHSQLAAAIEYSLCQKGKRVRPVLVLAGCEACGGRLDDADAAALAVECIHTFSLIHDDLPAMDDDDLRRGVATNHKVFGEALAILAGDWLVAEAFALLAESPCPRRGEMVAALADGTKAMTIGQAADIAGERRPADRGLLEFIHRHKTAGLLEASCRMGALAGGASDAQIAALSRFGAHLGLAFQIVDDVLDCTGTTATLGKRSGKDCAVEKQTYPAAVGVEESRKLAAAEIAAARAALAPFGARASNLARLAEYVLSRER